MTQGNPLSINRELIKGVATDDKIIALKEVLNG